MDYPVKTQNIILCEKYFKSDTQLSCQQLAIYQSKLAYKNYPL
jgi:hypothetical protein